MIWDDGRRTGFRSYQTLDPKPQTRSSPSTNHYSLITSHGSQEHTPRRQEHAATPLERGSQIKSGLAAFQRSEWIRGKGLEARGKKTKISFSRKCGLTGS